MAVHPTAIVEDGALLSGDVEVGPYCIVGAGAALWPGVRLPSHVVIHANTKGGACSIVAAHAGFGGEAQSRNASAPEAKLIVGANNVIREGVTISAGSRRGGGITRIGDG